MARRNRFSPQVIGGEGVQLLEAAKLRRCTRHLAQNTAGPVKQNTAGPVKLLPKSSPSDAHNALRTQDEINSGPISASDDRRARAARSGPGTDLEITESDTDSRGDVQPGGVRDEDVDDEERTPTGAADPA